MSRSSRDTGHPCDSCSRVGHVSTRSCPSAIPVASYLHQINGALFPERTECACPQLPRQMAHTCAISWAGTWCGHLGVLRRWGHLRALWRCGPLRVLWRVLSRSGLQRALSRSCERRQAWRSRGRWACVGHERQRACGSRGWWRACGSRGWLVLAWGRTLSRHQRISSLQFSYVVSGRFMGWW